MFLACKHDRCDQLGGRVDQTNPRQAELPVLDSHAASFAQQSLPVRGLHDGLVELAERGIQAVDVQDARFGLLAFGDIMHGSDQMGTGSIGLKNRDGGNLAVLSAGRILCNLFPTDRFSWCEWPFYSFQAPGSARVLE